MSPVSSHHHLPGHQYEACVRGYALSECYSTFALHIVIQNNKTKPYWTNIVTSPFNQLVHLSLVPSHFEIQFLAFLQLNGNRGKSDFRSVCSCLKPLNLPDCVAAPQVVHAASCLYSMPSPVLPFLLCCTDLQCSVPWRNEQAGAEPLSLGLSSGQ